MRSFAVLSLAALALAEPMALEKRQAQCQSTVSSACAQAASSLDLTPCINAACSSDCQAAVPQFKTCCANGSQSDAVLNCLTSQAGDLETSPAATSAVASVSSRFSAAVHSATAAASSLVASASEVVASATAPAPTATKTGAASVVGMDASLGLFAGLVGLALL